MGNSCACDSSCDKRKLEQSDEDSNSFQKVAFGLVKKNKPALGKEVRITVSSDWRHAELEQVRSVREFSVNSSKEEKDEISSLSFSEQTAAKTSKKRYR